MYKNTPNTYARVKCAPPYLGDGQHGGLIFVSCAQL
jgi:hypothetical protein